MKHKTRRVSPESLGALGIGAALGLMLCVAEVRAQDDSRLSFAEVDWLRQKIAKCYAAPVEVFEAKNLQVHVQFDLDRSGKVIGTLQVIELDQSGKVKETLQVTELDKSGKVKGKPFINRQPHPHPLFDVAATQAVRAVLLCQPYDRLPRKKYEDWRRIILTFDPRKMTFIK